MQFKVTLVTVNERDKCPMVDICTTGRDGKEDFSYANILGMYGTKSSQGAGMQVNDPELEKPLMKMCHKIAQAVYDYQKERNNGKKKI